MLEIRAHAVFNFLESLMYINAVIRIYNLLFYLTKIGTRTDFDLFSYLLRRRSALRVTYEI